MYQSHWGLQESPFRDCLDPQFFYQSPTHDEALARLQFLVEEHRRLGLLMGPDGSGKSLVLEVLAAQLQRAGCIVAKISLVGMEPDEILWHLVAQFGRNVDRPQSTAALWRALTDRLTELRYQQLDAIALLDDADQAGQQVLPHLIRLAKHDPSPHARLTLILTGCRAQMGRLGATLLGMSELRVDLEPWERGDIEGFLRSSLKQAGCRNPVFDDPAIARLCELSHGIPRHVRQLADLALVAGAGHDLSQIDADVVESVFHELGAVEV
jgi:type II secretory pathway predicted ATPase ExeA